MLETLQHLFQVHLKICNVMTNQKIIELINENIRIFIKENFTQTISNEIKRFSNRYEGRNVVWYGDPEQMIVIHKDNVHGMFGNIYDESKMSQILELLKDARYEGEKVELECSYGLGDLVSLQEIEEHQQAVIQERFLSDYDGHDRPYSTDNDEVDKYLGTDEMYNQPFVEDNDVDDPQTIKFFETHKYDLVSKKSDENTLTRLFNEIKPDELEIQAFREFIVLEEELLNCNESQTGDINEFNVQLRDGHHRVMAAIESGEKYVCLNLVKEHISKFNEYISRVTTK
jgi:hypothetical protein